MRGCFYYLAAKNSLIKGCYASIENDLNSAIELVTILKGKYDEFYLIDPDFPYRLLESGLSRHEIPSFLKVIISSNTASRIAYVPPNHEVKRIYLMFEKSVDDCNWLSIPNASRILLVSFSFILDSINRGDVYPDTMILAPFLDTFK